MKANATSGNVYTVHTNKYVEHVPCKPTTNCLCWIIKGLDKVGNESVRIQSTLCEVACEQNSRGLKIAVVKIYHTVVRA